MAWKQMATTCLQYRSRRILLTLFITTAIVVLLLHAPKVDVAKYMATESSDAEKLSNCNVDNSTLVGPIPVEKRIGKALPALKKFEKTVNKGGWWQPTTCAPTVKVAVITPFRNRADQLKLFLNHMHPFLQKQKLYYRIIVVEQLPGSTWNKGILVNVGFLHALKMSPFDCFVFTDIDYLPEDDRNNYGCPTSPIHMVTKADFRGYKFKPHPWLNGVFGIKKAHFEMTNGMSNHYWGWGGEDNDMYWRIKEKKLALTRPAVLTGRYTTIKTGHFVSATHNTLRHKLFDDGKAGQRMPVDGLNSLIYYLKEVVEYPLVTFIKVKLNQSDYPLPDYIRSFIAARDSKDRI